MDIFDKVATNQIATFFDCKLLRRLKQAQIVAMQVPDVVESLWYENEAGERWIPDYNKPDGGITPPEGYIYQHSRFPCQVTDTILRMIVPSEVENCPHADENVVRTHGWIDGVEGRECKMCGGSQTKNVSEPWPEKWDANGSRQFMSGTQSFSEDLALALVHTMNWSLRKAILVAALSCERCMNVLANKCGLPWGYAEDSDDYRKSGTQCEFCKAQSVTAAVPEGFPTGIRFPYLHPAIVGLFQAQTLTAWQLYYRASRDFINKKIEDWASCSWQNNLTSVDHDSDEIVSIDQSPQGIRVSFWGIPKIRGNDQQQIGELLAGVIAKPNRYLSINSDILYKVTEIEPRAKNQHVLYRAVIHAFPNSCFEETTFSKLIAYPDLPLLDDIVGEPICLQYYTTPARRAAWAVMQANPQWVDAPQAIEDFVAWFQNHFWGSLKKAVYISTTDDLLAHQIDVVLPNAEFVADILASASVAKRLEHLECTPIIIIDMAGKIHLISGVHRKNILMKSGDDSMRAWVIDASDLWNAYKAR
jgi:hypothetical protein